MKKNLKILKKCPLFENIEEEKLPILIDCLGTKIIHVSKGQQIFSEGDKAEDIGILINGNIQVVRDDYFGNRSILANLETGNLFAEAFACSEIKVLPVSVFAVSDCDIMLIKCERILSPCCNACDFHSKLIHNLVKILAHKNIMLNQKIEVTSKRTTREKLMTYLLGQAKKQGKDSFFIPYDRQELADYLEVERSAMSAEIGKLCKEGVIETKKNWFRIK